MKKIFIFLGLFFVTPHAHALTLQQLLTEVRIRIKDTSTTRQRYSDTQLTNILNEGQRDVINNTWGIETSSTITTSAGTTYYAMPSDLIVISRLTSNGKVIPETTLIQLDSLSGGSSWSTINSRTVQYYFVDRTKVTAGVPNLGIYPYPTDTLSTTTVTFNYYGRAADLVSSSDIPFNGYTQLYQYHDTLIYYTAAVVYAIESESDKAKEYASLYSMQIQLMYQALGKRPNYLPSFSGPANSR